MHIAEGVLSAPVLIAGAAAAAAGIAVGLKRLDESRLMTAGLVGAAFFIASLIHVPIGVSSAHLLLCGLVGVMLGVSAYPVILQRFCCRECSLNLAGSPCSASTQLRWEPAHWLQACFSMRWFTLAYRAGD